MKATTTTQTFNVSFPKGLLQQVDAKAEEQFGSRSDFLRTAALQYLRNEAEWDYIFNEGKKIGAQGEYQSEEEVADAINSARRAGGRWFVKE